MPTQQQANTRVHAPLAVLAIGAMGVVFGDIGTSPLYTLKTVLDLSGGPSRETILGIVSLLVWTLIVITSVKYATFAMSIDNDGEGGIVALMTLLGVKRSHRPLIVAIGLLGAALIYGDGAVTPAISVLSALEGLNIIEPSLQRYVLPLAVALLLALFALQPLGTARIGRAFGPIMLIWFVTMAVLGVRGIIQHPGVLRALNPWYGFDYLFHSGSAGFVVLGGVFLCVTGAEALYADMGHFGAFPIRLSWGALIFPSLVLNYAGQGAIVLDGASTEGNIFYRLCPAQFLVPMVLLATVATIIASQSIISGAFSMTRQAIQLGWMPRLKVVQTSEEGYGQIYVGAVNWLLMLATVGLALGFRKSDNLAAAYGIAVSATMLLTSVLLFIAMRELWKWNLAASLAVACVFLIVDSAFLASNLLKVLQGGWVPLLLASAVYLVMYVWHRGMVAIAASANENPAPVPEFMASLARDHVARVPGTAVFLTRVRNATPAVMRWYVKHSHALHESVIAITLDTASVPRVAIDRRLQVTEVAPGFWAAYALYGFMQRPDMPQLMSALKLRGCAVEPGKLTYFVGAERVMAREDGRGLPRWIELLFAALLRNSTRLTDYLHVPREQVVELGRQIAI